LLLVIEQGAGPQHEGGGADPHLYLAKGEVQTVMGGKPAGEMALDEGRRLPEQDGDADEQEREKIEGIAQQTSGQRLEHDGLHLMRIW